MEITYGTGVGLHNRFEALFLDNSNDPLDAISKSTKKKNNKSKLTKDNTAKTKTKLEAKQEQSKPRDTQAANKKSGKWNKGSAGLSDKPPNKPKKRAKPSAPGPVKPIDVPFEQMLTLEEYREKKTVHNTPLYNLRQPGEGEDLSQWEKLVPLEKKKHDKEAKEVVYESSECPQRAGRVQRFAVRVKIGDSLVQQATTTRDIMAARLAAAAAAPAQPINRKRPPKLNEYEFPTLG